MEELRPDFGSWIDKHDEEIKELRKLDQLRREEEARMAERFDQIIQNQKNFEALLAKQSELITETRDLALRNNHDLNNGLKSTVTEMAQRLSRTEAQSNVNKSSLSAHESASPMNVERIVQGVLDKQSTKKKRTIEIGMGIIVAIVALDSSGIFDWFFGLIGG